jgi:hypothetical protein
MFSRPSRCVLSLSALLLIAPAVYAQGGFGAIRGSIKDSSGAIVPGAKIAAVEVSTGTRNDALTDAEGNFLFPRLKPSVYQITAEASGFKKLDRKGIELRVSDSLTLDLVLEVGTQNETVTVTGEVPLLRTSDAQSGEVINNTLISNIPQLSRDPLRLLVLSGNVQGSGSRAEPGSDTRINGGRTVGLEYRVDGVTAGTGMGHKVVDTAPSMETVAEFKVITNGISAEYGRLSGGAIEVVTKSGSNAFHGQLFEYFQNDNLNANSWQQNSLGGKKVKFSQNIFGGTVGGPVAIPKVYDGQNKTFFFFNYEGMRRWKAGALQQTSVPTELERKGDFSQTVYNGISPVLFDQNGPVVFDAVNNQYIRQNLIGNGKVIPQSQISPVSLALLKNVPMPNTAPTPGTSSTNNYVAPRSEFGNRDVYGLRIDHNFNEKQRFFGRFTHRDSESGNTNWRGAASTAAQNRNKGSLNVTVNYSWMMSPSLIFEARAGASHFPASVGNLLPASFTSSDIPLDAITRSLVGTSNLPLIRTPNTTISDNASLSVTNSTTYDHSFSFTKILNRHTIKTGFQMYRFFDNFSKSAGGTFSFQAAPVHQIAGVDFGFGSDISFAYGMAAFMVGTNNQAELSGGTTRANNFNYYASYIQDDYRVSDKLTLNLGLRWDMDSPITERHDKLYFWDPDATAPFSINSGYDFNAAVRAAGLDPASVRTPDWVKNGFAKGAMRIANTPEFPSRTGTSYRKGQFAPRIGAAYQLDSKTVIRSSFAMMYIPATGSESAYSGSGLPLADTASAGWHASTDNMVHLYSNWASPFLPGQYVQYQRTNAGANYGATGPTSPAGFSRTSHMSKEYTLSFGIQRELKGNMVVEGSYNGNLGRDLVGPDYVGRFPVDLFTGGPAGTNVRTYTTQIASPTAGQTQNNSVVGPKQNLAILEMAYPYFGAIGVQGVNFGRSNFHAANLRVEKRMSHGLFFLGNYTFSKSLDDVGGPDGAVGANNTVLGGKRQQNTDSLTQVYGISPLDETHVFRFASNYQLPVGRGKAWLSNPQSFGAKLLDGAVGGWELAGMGTYRSGRPVVLTATTPNINNNIRVEWTYGNFTDPSNPTIDNPAFGGKNQVFYSTRDNVSATPIRRFFNASDAQQFTYGTLPPIFPNTRHPMNFNYDMSLMKSFPFTAENRSYLQFRMEATNFFNIRGYGAYNTTIGNRYFGMITAAGNTERSIQMSARIIF